MTNDAKNADPKSKIATIGLALILIIALALRLAGITWGLPNSLHLFSYHPDESVMLTTATPDLGGLNFFAGKFLPHYYNYGSLPFYLDYFAVTVGEAYHWIGPIVVGGQFDSANWAKAYLAGRLISVLMGVGTVWATYALGRLLWGRRVGLIAAFILAIMPLHVQQSHFATVDVGSAFWLTLSMLWASKAVDPKVDLKAVIFAGIFAGLTAATKYTGGLVILCLAVPLIVRARRGDFKAVVAIRIMAIGLVSAIIAFIIACPGCLFDTAQFIHDVRFESDHVMHHGEVAFAGTGLGWVYIVTRNLNAGLGLPLLLFSIVSIVYALYRRHWADAFLAMFALPLYLILGAAESRYARYEVPLLPILAIWTARFSAFLAWKIQREMYNSMQAKAKFSNKKFWANLALTEFYACSSILPVMLSGFATWSLIAPMLQIDNRDRAAVWLQQNAPSPTPIAFGEQPWFWTPPINPFFTLPQYGAWKRATPPEVQARYVYNPNMALDSSTLLRSKPPIVVLSEYEYEDPLRLCESSALGYVALLRQQYQEPIIFKSEHPEGGHTLIDGLPTQDLPHDMLYASPTVLIFVRRAD